MPYTFYAIACYIFMRGLQVLFEEHKEERWYKILIKSVTVFMLIVSLLAVANLYTELNLLGIQLD